jgi:UDPglucose 6-dehydrogenase
MRISVFGLGKVGITLSSCLATAGHQVVGVDVNEAVVTAFNDRTLSSAEPGVNDRLRAAPRARLSATLSAEEAVIESDLSFIIVPTPSNTLGGFSVRHVVDACDQIGKALRKKSSDHVVSLVSTVLPGSSDHIIIPALEAASGRKVGHGLGYCYNPSFIALGEIVQGIERPDYILIGESDAETGAIVLAAHQAMIPDATPVARMHPIEAEVTKLASNTHETMRVSFANMLLSVCSEIPNANVDRITGALAHRMGHRFFKGAVPYGGPCWPRDNEALSVFMDTIGVSSRMPRNVDLFNAEHGRFILRKILEIAEPGSTVGLIGMAYKPGTSVIERAYGVDLASWLIAERRSVVAWDPMALAEVKNVLDGSLAYASSLADCVKRSDVTVIVNPLKDIEAADWSLAGGKIVLDCWRALKPPQVELVGRYVGLGQGPGANEAFWLDRNVGRRLDLLSN